MRTRPAPAWWSMRAWAEVASTSWVRVAHIDCTTIGFPPPIVTVPARTVLLLARFMVEVYQAGQRWSLSPLTMLMLTRVRGWCGAAIVIA